MTVTAKRFAGYPAQFKDTGPTTVDFQDLVGYSVSSNNTISPKIPMGSIDPVAYSVAKSQPTISMQTMDLLTLLTNVSLNRPKLWDADSRFFFRERSDDGFMTGTTHPGRLVKKGVMVINSISASVDDRDGASADLTFTPLYNGTDIPVTNLTSQDLAAAGMPAPAYVSSYHLFCPYHNGSQVEGVQSITINPGITLVTAQNCPGTFDENAAVSRTEPNITLRGLKIDEANAYGITGGQVDTSFAIYLQKADVANAAGTGRIAPATAQHIKISFTAGHIDVTSVGAQGTDDGSVEITIRPAGVIAVSTASAIP